MHIPNSIQKIVSHILKQTELSPKYIGDGLTYDDILLVPRLNSQGSRKNVSVEQTDRSEQFRLDIPLISANMDRITGHKMADYMNSKGGIGALHRLMSPNENVSELKRCQSRCFVSVGCNEKGLARTERLYEAGARLFNLDVAHGHSTEMGTTLEEMRKRYSDIFIMAGNVATREGTQYLYDHGAHMVKVGIGGGSVCTTREKTGFGVPNVSALLDCTKVDCSIVADGGIRKPADVVKALCLGADFVMIGGMLAGTQPTPGEIEEKDGKKFKNYRGLDSKESQLSWFGEVPKWRTPEGVSTLIPYRENIDAIIDDIVGGLRSALTYSGASNIKELQQNTKFRIVSGASYREGLAHGLY